MASVHAAHARRGDRVTSWWRGTSLRAKVTGVTVAVLAVGLLAAGLGTGGFLRNAQIAALDPINPQVAARLARCFDRWRKFDAQRQDYACSALESLHARPGLSRDVFEVVDKALG